MVPLPSFQWKSTNWNPQLCWQTCISQAQLKLMFDELDEDGSGELTLDEINAAPPVTWAKQVKKVQSQVFRWYDSRQSWLFWWLPDVFPFVWTLWFWTQYRCKPRMWCNPSLRLQARRTSQLFLFFGLQNRIVVQFEMATWYGTCSSEALEQEPVK